jgi:hypothetical protein
MPKATVSSETTKFDLKTLPGAWVELRRLSFGEKAQRTDMAMKMAFEGGKGKDGKALAEMASVQTSVFEFSRCVVNHNLFKDDEDKVPMDLHNAIDVQQLDPRVGEEIGTYIDQMNNFDQEVLDDLGNGSSS